MNMYYSYRSTYRHNRSNFEKSKETAGFKGWRKAQYQAQSGHCAWCYDLVSYKDMDVDHIVPLSVQGYDTNANNYENLVLACHKCNRDIKKASTYNIIAYQNTLNKMTKQQKQEGWAPKKMYWRRPEWIGPNRYCDTFEDYTPKDVPITERNVWEIDAPLIRDYSLKINDFTYFISNISDIISGNSEIIWKIVKWASVTGIILLVIFAFTEATKPKNTSTKKYCNFECQEESRIKYENEENKRVQKEKEEELQEAKRYWKCINAGGSEYDCG